MKQKDKRNKKSSNWTYKFEKINHDTIKRKKFYKAKIKNLMA